MNSSQPNASSTTGGASANNAKLPQATSPPTPDRTPGHLLGLLTAIESFVHTPELREAIVALEKNPNDSLALLKARGELNKLVRLLLDAFGGSMATELTQLKQLVEEMKTKVDALHERANSDDLGTFLKPGSDLSFRYTNEHPEEKKAVSEYVAQKFFPDEKIYAYIQASVTALHLAQVLAKQTLRRGSLFYTNSAVVPLVLLQHLRGVSVYTVCGNVYDDMCGGWLPRMEDDEGRAHLAQLFQRDTDRLLDSFITPIAVDCNSGEVLFTKEELVHLLKGVIAPSRQLIVMTISSRIHTNHEAVQREHKHHALAGFRLSGRPAGAKPPQLVVSHDKNDGKSDAERQQSIDQLTALGFDVHWQWVQKGWQIYPAVEKS